MRKLYRMDLYYNQIGYNLNLINPLNDMIGRIKSNLTIGLVGYSGCGKSTLINLIFNELVAKVSTSATDVTTQCTEYYLPIQNINENEQNIGQIRFLDFPGITEDSNYENIVEPKIENKIKEYKNNYEQIDIALFYIPNGVVREITNSGKKLMKLLHKNKIKIIFIINGECKNFLLEDKKNKLKNCIREIETNNNNNILNEDFSNFIHTDYYQYFDSISKEGISTILKKILEISKKGLINFNIKEITSENFNEQLDYLKKNNRIFQLYENISVFKKSAKIKATFSVLGYSALSCGTSALSLIVPVVDSVISIIYQIGMVYNILYIYELNSRDYNITNIILSGGNTIENENLNMNENNNEEELTNGKIRETVGDISKVAVQGSKYGIECIAKKEAEKKIIKTITTSMVKEKTSLSLLNISGNTISSTGNSITKKTIEKTIETKLVNSLADKGIKEGTKRLLSESVKQTYSKQLLNVGSQMIQSEIGDEASKMIFKKASKKIIDEGITKISKTSTEYLTYNTAYNTVTSLGGGETFFLASKETTKEITEKIVIKEGGKSWLVNLGKYVPFIGAGISAIMNTYSTAKIGYKLVSKFDEEFDLNKQRKVDMLKGRIYSLLNICKQIEQINSLIENEL